MLRGEAPSTATDRQLESLKPQQQKNLSCVRHQIFFIKILFASSSWRNFGKHVLCVAYAVTSPTASFDFFQRLFSEKKKFFSERNFFLIAFVETRVGGQVRYPLRGIKSRNKQNRVNKKPSKEFGTLL